jgi:hypothetical protein
MTEEQLIEEYSKEIFGNLYIDEYTDEKRMRDIFWNYLNFGLYGNQIYD